jgi:serine O-acetyltransferase
MPDKAAVTINSTDGDTGPRLEQTAHDLAQAAFIPGRQVSGAGTQPLPIPSRDAIIHIVETLRSVLFPGYFGEAGQSGDTLHVTIGASLDRIRSELREQILHGLCFMCAEDSCTTDCYDRATTITNGFLAQLPAIQQLLIKDAIAAYEGDPACISKYEPVCSYPCMLALTNQRLAHALYAYDVPLIPRIITEYAHSLTGIDIHPGARIGASFFIDHGTGVVIGETSIIGDHVKLYQGVTLGAKSFPLDAQGHPVKGRARHPIVEDHVTIYAGATVLGRVRIGTGSVIGGNIWLTHSIPPNSHLLQAQAQATAFDHGGGI